MRRLNKFLFKIVVVASNYPELLEPDMKTPPDNKAALSSKRFLGVFFEHSDLLQSPNRGARTCNHQSNLTNQDQNCAE